MCFLNTVTPGTAAQGVPTPFEFPWFTWAQTEAAQAVLSNLGSTVLSVMKRIGFERSAQVDETWVRAYASPFPTAEECRGAVAFPAAIAAEATLEVMIENLDQLPSLAALPAMYVHGEEDRALPLEYSVSGFRSTWPSGPIVTLPGVGHFLQEDAPEAVIALIEQFIQITA